MGDPLGLLGLARRAGRVAVGSEASLAAMRAGAAWLVCAASDVSQGSFRRIQAAMGANTPFIQLPNTKAELGRLFGREMCGILAVTDLEFAAGFIEALAAAQSDRYGEAARLLAAGAGKTRLRKKAKEKSGKRRKQ